MHNAIVIYMGYCLRLSAYVHWPPDDNVEYVLINPVMMKASFLLHMKNLHLADDETLS